MALEPAASGDRQRLDRWLFFARAAKSRTLAQKLIEAGLVRVNARRTLASDHQVGPGDVLTMTLGRQLRIWRVLGVAKLPYFSLPNLLAGRGLVPEFVQGQVRADVLGPAVLGALDGTALPNGWYDAFAEIHRQLRCDASASAAREVLALVRGKG